MAISKELQKKIDFAIKLIQSASEMASKVGQPIEVAFSGGKDSAVILELTKMANVPYRAIYKNTTIDPPGTIKYCKDNGVEIHKPSMTFLQLVEKKGYPSRRVRTCCEQLKEYKILDYVILGVRKDESTARKKRYKEPELCRVYRNKEKARHYYPLLEWTAKDVENFILERHIKCHPLYYDEDGNFHVERRLGCIGCPLSSKQKDDFKKYPKLLKQIIIAQKKWADEHPHARYWVNFDNIYNLFFFKLFCDSYQDYFHKLQPDLWGEVIDCKKFLEDYFNIKFD